MVNYDLNQEFISQVELPKTSADYPQIRYVDAANVDRALFSRVGWFPATEGIKRKSIYVLFVGTAEAIEKHAPAIADVCARGNDVMVFEFAGQGGSGRFLEDVRKVHAMPDGFDMWTDSVKEFLRSDLFRAARQRGYDNDMNVVALPYSLGGHMFGRVMQEAPALSKRFTRIVYVNPVVAMNSAGSMIMRLGQQLVARFSVIESGKSDAFVPGHGKHHPGDRPLAKSSIGTDQARHEWMCKFYHTNEHLGMWGMTYGWFHEANRSLTKFWATITKGETWNPLLWLWGEVRSQELPRKNASRVPTLVISSQRDTIVIAYYVRRFAKYIGADTLLLPRAKHEPSQEPPLIREATFDAVAAWVANPDRPDIAESSDVKLVQKRSRPGDARYGFISSAP